MPSDAGTGSSPATRRVTTASPRLIAGIIGQIIAEHRIDTARVYVAGLSAGGARRRSWPKPTRTCSPPSAFIRALPAAPPATCPRPSRDAAGAHRRQPATGAGVPTILFHGDTDRTVNPSTATRWRQGRWPGAMGLRTEIDEGRSPGGLAYHRARHLDGSGRPLLERWTVHGAGHAWSGGSPDGSFTEPARPRRLARHGRVLPGARTGARLMSAPGTHTAHAR